MTGNYLKFTSLHYGIGLAVLVASHLFVYFTGREHGLSKYHDFRAQVEVAQATLEADAAKARLESERITTDVSLAWQSALDHAARNPRIVRVQAPCDPSGLRSVSSAPGITAQTAIEPGLGASINVAAEDCEVRLNNAVVDAAMVLHLQSWVQQQHEVSK